MATTDKPSLKETVRQLAILPLYRAWNPEMVAKAEAGDAAARRWASMIWVRISGGKLYPSYYDASAKPVAINDALIGPLEGVRFEDEQGNEFLITGGRVLHAGEVVLSGEELLAELNSINAADATVTDIPIRSAEEVACA